MDGTIFKAVQLHMHEDVVLAGPPVTSKLQTQNAPKAYTQHSNPYTTEVLKINPPI